ncbi:MAG TPA: AsmA family protein [Caulobacteraceae bacterium]|nr:AsmA family protein [Caulobacteraceae bacterium]
MSASVDEPDLVEREPPPPPRRRVRWGWIVFTLVVTAMVILAILFRWDWLRGPLARYLSGRLHRPVEITGHLHVHPWSWTPEATVSGVVIGNAPWAGKTPLASLPRFTIKAKILPLVFHGQLILPFVEADQPRVDLLRDLNGRENWATPRKGPAKPLKLPPIGHLIIRDGDLRYVDEVRKLVFAGTVSSSEEAAGSGRGVFVMDGQGTLNKEPFVAHVRGGALIHVDPNRPYDFQASLKAGPTQARLEGHIDHPFNFAAVSGRGEISGPDLARLYAVTGIAFPDTPPYRLTAGFGRRQQVYALRRIQGRVGGSDLEGALTVDDSTGRMDVTGALSSHRMRMADLVAVVGGSAKHARASELSPLQQAQAAKMKAEHSLLPDVPIHLDRLRSMDADATYSATLVDAGHFPMRDFRMRVRLDHGLLTVDPLSVDISQGRLAGMIRLDGRHAVPVSAIDLRLSNAQLAPLIKAKGPNPPVQASLWARARLEGAGASVRTAAAHANGSVTVVIPSGKLRKLIGNLINFNLDRTAFLLITKNKSDTPIHCAVMDFQARQGVLTIDRGVMDTGEAQITGTGDLSLRDETLDLRFSAKPKKFSIIRLNAPITVKGRLDAPKPGVDIVHAIPQAAGAVALGVVAAPLVAILPFVGPGLAHNADCQALVGAAEAPRGPMRTARH